MRIFYSWQSDLPNATNRGFIQQALEHAVNSLRKDESLKIEPFIDRDTQSVPGCPDIADTVFSKIAQSQAFVCDVSIINSGEETSPTSNPNVLVEFGFAFRSLGPEHIIMVMNTAFGGPELLPFDLRKRRVITYNMPLENIDRASERKRLEAVLFEGLRSMIVSLGNQATVGTTSSSPFNGSSYLRLFKNRLGIGAFFKKQLKTSVVLISILFLLVAVGVLLLRQLRHYDKAETVVSRPSSTLKKHPSPEGFLSFAEGDPHAPGDGIFVKPLGEETIMGDSKGVYYKFSLKPSFSLGGIESGLTATIFLPPEVTNPEDYDNLQMDYSNLVASGPCKLNVGAAVPGSVERVIFKDTKGVSFHIPQPFLEDLLRSAGKQYPGCDFSLNDLQIVSFSLFSPKDRQFMSMVDAVKIARNQ